MLAVALEANQPAQVLEEGLRVAAFVAAITPFGDELLWCHAPMPPRSQPIMPGT